MLSPWDLLWLVSFSKYAVQIYVGLFTIRFLYVGLD